MTTLIAKADQLLDDIVAAHDGNTRRLPQVVAMNPHLMRLPIQLPENTRINMPAQESTVTTRVNLWGS